MRPRPHLQCAVKAHTLLHDDGADSELLAEEAQGHVGGAEECGGRVVDAHPLQTPCGTVAQEVGGAGKGRVVEGGDGVVLRQQRVGLRAHGCGTGCEE